MERLTREHRRELRANPEGVGLVADAIGDAIRLGFESQLKLLPDHDPNLSGAGLAVAWHAERDRSVEGRSWPLELEAASPQTIRKARELVAGAALSLGMHSRARRLLVDEGGQAAEAGAALARAACGT